METILEQLQKEHIQYLMTLNISQFPNGVKAGFGKNMEKKLDIYLMELI